MVSRRTIALLVGLVVIGSLVWYGTATRSAQPTLTVENEDNVSYAVTAYTVESRQAAMYLNFEVTTRDGERRLATLSQLIWPDGYRNVTLADEDVPSQRLVVDPGENVTTTVEGWERGDVTVYLAAERDGNETHVYTEVKTCARRGQEHGITFQPDGTEGFSTCAGPGLLP